MGSETDDDFIRLVDIPTIGQLYKGFELASPPADHLRYEANASLLEKVSLQ